MWFKKRYHELRYRFLLWQKEQQSVEERRAMLLSQLEPTLFAHNNINKDCLYRLAVVLPTIGDYLRLLRSIDFQMSQGLRVSLNSSPLQITSVTVEQFFMDGQRRYVDRPRHVAEFTSLTQSTMVHLKSLGNAELGDPGYNSRQLTKVMVSMIALAEQLRDYSTS